MQELLPKIKDAGGVILEIYRKVDNHFIGMCHLGPLSTEHKTYFNLSETFKQTSKTLEIGFWLGIDYNGHGYMTECVTALINYGFTVLNVECIFALIASDNDKSKQVAMRAGLQCIGRMMHTEEARGDWGEKEFEGFCIRRD